MAQNRTPNLANSHSLAIAPRTHDPKTGFTLPSGPFGTIEEFICKLEKECIKSGFWIFPENIHRLDNLDSTITNDFNLIPSQASNRKIANDTRHIVLQARWEKKGSKDSGLHEPPRHRVNKDLLSIPSRTCIFIQASMLSFESI